MKAAVNQDKKRDEQPTSKSAKSYPAPGQHIATNFAQQAGQLVAQRASAQTSAVIQLYRPNQGEIGSIFLIKDPRNASKEVAARFIGAGSAVAGYEFEWHGEPLYVIESDIIGPIPKSGLKPKAYKEEEDEVEDMELSSPELSSSAIGKSDESVPHHVISGHGAFNEHYLASAGPKRSDGKKAKFVVPEGKTIVLYAPPGAALENQVANAIESGNYPSAEQVMLENNANYTRLDVPTPYPYVFTAGQEVINYTVTPPNKLKVVGNPTTVKSPTSLFELISGIEGEAIIHYACCSSAYSDKFKDLFDYRGFNVSFKR